MDDHDPGEGVRYVATLPHVREVALLGTADRGDWADRLRGEGLSPADFDGEARVLITAIESRFLGLRFRELTLSVFAFRTEADARRDGLYLALAFNSSRLFAAVERTAFATPSRHGEIRVDLGPPACFGLVGGDVDLRAEMSPDTTATRREPLRVGDEGWAGAVFLPGTGRGSEAPGKWFFARVGGRTVSYPFCTPGDALTIGPTRGLPPLSWVFESNFRGREWSIREDATHARTKTFKEGAARGRVAGS